MIKSLLAVYSEFEANNVISLLPIKPDVGVMVRIPLAIDSVRLSAGVAR